MANHMFKQLFYSLFNKPVKIACVATLAATPTVLGRGVTSFLKTATGTYELTLDQKYYYLFGLSVKLLRATAADFTFQIKAETVATDGKIQIFTLLDGVATDLTNGDKLFIEVLLNDSSTI